MVLIPGSGRSLRREMAGFSIIFLPGKFHRQEPSPWSKRVKTWLKAEHIHTHIQTSFYSNFKHPDLLGNKQHIRLKVQWVNFSYQLKQFENEFAICILFSLKLHQTSFNYVFCIFIFHNFQILINLRAVVGQVFLSSICCNSVFRLKVRSAMVL